MEMANPNTDEGEADLFKTPGRFYRRLGNGSTRQPMKSSASIALEDTIRN